MRRALGRNGGLGAQGLPGGSAHEKREGIMAKTRIETKVVRAMPHSRQVRKLLKAGWEIEASRGGHLMNVPTLTLVRRAGDE